MQADRHRAGVPAVVNGWNCDTWVWGFHYFGIGVVWSRLWGPARAEDANGLSQKGDSDGRREIGLPSGRLAHPKNCPQMLPATPRRTNHRRRLKMVSTFQVRAGWGMKEVWGPKWASTPERSVKHCYLSAGSTWCQHEGESGIGIGVQRPFCWYGEIQLIKRVARFMNVSNNKSS